MKEENIANRINCFAPLLNQYTRVLILGTIPGSVSLKLSMYYGNENNHFWDFIYRILVRAHPQEQLVPKDGYREKHYKLLTDNFVGLWDVVNNCLREGSNDSKIKDPVFNKISTIIETNIRVILCNGEKTYKYLKESRQLDDLNVPVRILSSTSTMSPTNTFKALNQWRDEFEKWL
ncbi:MAG: glycosylase [Mucilaginibacter sp.]|nr:glycosylase [Mucilaginibacter sp.]